MSENILSMPESFAMKANYSLYSACDKRNDSEEKELQEKERVGRLHLMYQNEDKTQFFKNLRRVHVRVQLYNGELHETFIQCQTKVNDRIMYKMNINGTNAIVDLQPGGGNTFKVLWKKHLDKPAPKPKKAETRSCFVTFSRTIEAADDLSDVFNSKHTPSPGTPVHCTVFFEHNSIVDEGGPKKKGKKRRAEPTPEEEEERQPVVYDKNTCRLIVMGSHVNEFIMADNLPSMEVDLIEVPLASVLQMACFNKEVTEPDWLSIMHVSYIPNKIIRMQEIQRRLEAGQSAVDEAVDSASEDSGNEADDTLRGFIVEDCGSGVEEVDED